MADNEWLRKPQFPRRNTPTRPPPGVQKALHNFGVPDLRELINKKHQNQGDSPRDKKPEPKENLPPPDPSYNYLKDPARDRPKPPPPKREDSKDPPERQHGNSNVKNKHRIAQKEYIHPRYREREQQENNNGHGERFSPQNSFQNRENGAAKRELRFTEAAAVSEVESQFPRGGRGGFRGRNPGGFRGRGRGGKPREDRQEIIENPVNIKVQLSTETGQRSCILDENTKIPDIKHVPDQFPHYRSPRGGFRGARGNFRGKKRGSFRGRRGRTEYSENPDNADVTENVNIEENNVGDETNETADVKQEDNEAPYEEYEQESNENEEFVDSNENYEAEFSSEYQEDSPSKNLDENNLPEQTTNSFDPNLADTITITSSKYQDGEVKRSVEVKAGVGDANDVGDCLVKEDGADEKVES